MNFETNPEPNKPHPNPPQKGEGEKTLLLPPPFGGGLGWGFVVSGVVSALKGLTKLCLILIILLISNSCKDSLGLEPNVRKSLIDSVNNHKPLLYRLKFYSRHFKL